MFVSPALQRGNSDPQKTASPVGMTPSTICIRRRH